MKTFKITSTVMLIIASALFVFSVTISAVAATAEENIFLALVQANALLLACSGAGIFLKFSKNETASKIGNGLTVVAFIVGAICAFAALTILANSTTTSSGSGDVTPISIGAVCMLIAGAFLVLHYAFLIANIILNRNCTVTENPNEDIRIIRVKEWKQLVDDGIISEAEYEEKRMQILGIKTKNK